MTKRDVFLEEAPRSWHGRLLASFTEWFGSGPGVWQTAVLTVGVVVADFIAVQFFHRQPDPHLFYIMAVLTIYSAITQPALAHAGAVAQKLLMKILGVIHELLTDTREMMRAQRELLEQQRITLTRLERMMSDEYVVDTKTYDLLAHLIRSLEERNA